MKLRIANFFATGFYSGYCPVAPGTAGTLTATVLAGLFYYLIPSLATPFSGILLALFTIIIGIIAANAICDSGCYGEEVKDPQQIVIDEFAGYFVAIIGLEGRLMPMIIAFFCFRLFDITKPPPVRQLENLPRGYGIMLDDVMAGVYAAVLCRAALAFLI